MSSIELDSAIEDSDDFPLIADNEIDHSPDRLSTIDRAHLGIRNLVYTGVGPVGSNSIRLQRYFEILGFPATIKTEDIS